MMGLASIVAAATAARLRSSSLPTSAAGALSGGFIMLGGALSTPATELGPAMDIDGGGILGGGMLGGGIPGGRIKRGGGTPVKAKY